MQDGLVYVWEGKRIIYIPDRQRVYARSGSEFAGLNFHDKIYGRWVGPGKAKAAGTKRCSNAVFRADGCRGRGSQARLFKAGFPMKEDEHEEQWRSM